MKRENYETLRHILKQIDEADWRWAEAIRNEDPNTDYIYSLFLQELEGLTVSLEMILDDEEDNLQ